MSIKVLYFASLREKIGRASDVLELSESIQLNELWKKVTDQDTFPDDVLISVNQEYTSADSFVNDGDEVAFFPPVTGG